ncbi:MAG: hypothetical protein JXR86_06755 [Spirochaetales bacterium]|nr:hypothetical protein [Spirochaetales bacterium]
MKRFFYLLILIFSFPAFCDDSADSSQELSFSLSETAGSEKSPVPDLKRRLESAIDNNESLFDLRDEMTEVLEQMPDRMKDKPVLKDYRLKVLIEIEKRRAITDFIFGDEIDPSFFSADYDFALYDSQTTPASYDFKWALRDVLVLERLELLRILYKSDFQAFADESVRIESQLLLADKVSPEFSDSYRKDYESLYNLYRHYVDDRRIPRKKTLLEQLEIRYGEFWSFFIEVLSEGLELDTREVMAIKAAYSSLDLSRLWTPDVLKNGPRTLKFNAFAGGGSLLSAGLFWEPRPWFGLSLGVAGAYDFFERTEADPLYNKDNPSVTATVPLELDFFIVNKKLEIFLGITSDVVRITDVPVRHWSTSFLKDEDGMRTGSLFAFWTSLGVNIGIGLDLGKVEIYLSNYFYMPDTGNFNPSTLSYAPAIGMRL